MVNPDVDVYTKITGKHPEKHEKTITD